MHGLSLNRFGVVNVSVAKEITGRFLTFLNDLQRRYQLVSILCFSCIAVYSYRVEFFLASKLKPSLNTIRLANRRYRPGIFSRLSWIASLKVSIVNMKYLKKMEESSIGLRVSVLHIRRTCPLIRVGETCSLISIHSNAFVSIHGARCI